MSRVFRAIATLIEVFDEYAKKEGDAKTLSKIEVKSLLTEEFGTKLDSPSAENELFKALDVNVDGTVDFREFVSLVVTLTIIAQQIS